MCQAHAPKSPNCGTGTPSTARVLPLAIMPSSSILYVLRSLSPRRRKRSAQKHFARNVSFSLIFRHKHFAKHIRFERIAQTIKVAAQNELFDLFIIFNVAFYFCFLAAGKFGAIEFAARCSERRDNATGVKRGSSPRLVVGASRNMATHCAYGIAQRSSPLNSSSLKAVGVVTCPNLRKVI